MMLHYYEYSPSPHTELPLIISTQRGGRRSLMPLNISRAFYRIVLTANAGCINDLQYIAVQVSYARPLQCNQRAPDD